MNVAFFSRLYPGEAVCGDAVTVAFGEGEVTVAVIDGLGHGREAHIAAEAARLSILAGGTGPSPASLMLRCHDALKGTRGAAISVVRMTAQGQGAFCGVGNVAFATRSRQRVSVISHPGIVGHRMRKAVEYPFSLVPGDVVGLYSDGLTSALSLEQVDCRHLDASARQLVAAHGRPNDDATVLLLEV